MSNWQSIVDGLGVALAGTGLRFYGYAADRIETPAAIAPIPAVNPITAADGSFSFEFPLWVLVAKNDDKAAAKELTPYIDATGVKSIRQALRTNRTLGGACDSVAILNAEPQIATIAGTEYFAIEFSLEVIG